MDTPLLKLILSLLFASCICTLMALTRVNYEQNWHYLWLIRPNLVLAWIPLFFALVVHWIWTKKQKITIGMVLVSIPWLLFLPNAPYIVTDLVHLTYIKGTISIYFDLLLNMLTAFTALLVGFLSLYLLQNIVKEKYKTIIGWLFTLLILFLCSIGVFLGRFLRWNSWDVIFDFRNIIVNSIASMSQIPSLIFISTFSIFLVGAYTVFYCCVQLREN